jgi:hypothetical protein
MKTMKPEDWTPERIAESVQRITSKTIELYRQLGRPVPTPKQLQIFLCLICDQGAAVPVEGEGTIFLGTGCPDCDRPDSRAWTAFMTSMLPGQGGIQ